MYEPIIYVTYENSPRGTVTGLYANEKLAKQEAEERGDLSVIDSFILKGYNGTDYLNDINDNCKYFCSKLNTIRELISCLYSLEGCCTGGIAHIITDDNNINDSSIEFVLKECDKEENKDREECGLVKLICEELLKLSIQQRALLFSSYYTYLNCNKYCRNCPIEKGDIKDL